MKALRATILATVICLAVLAGTFFHNIFYSSPAVKVLPAEVRIEQGDSFATVARKLRAQNIISNAIFFSLWARVVGSDKKIHQGLYRFTDEVSPREVLERLVTGKGIFQIVTIPEGLTVREIAALLDKMQIASSDKILEAANDPALLASVGLQGKGIEGYLFPNTYHFVPGTPERDILLTMTEQFRKSVQPLLTQSVTEMTPYEVVTLASIIEKETGVESERPLVSAVFHNRLKHQMPLQSDPTVIYGLKDFNGNLTRKDLNDPSPYNTYRVAALPPGPICNPSLSSIRAALSPANVPYLYFVSKNDGTHLFSDTIEAHNHAVRIYQSAREPASRSRSVERH